jgi:hypothetical protein
MANPNRQVPKPGGGWYGDPEGHSRAGKLGAAALWRKVKDGTVKWRKLRDEALQDESLLDRGTPTPPNYPPMLTNRHRRRQLEDARRFKEEE